MRVPLGTSDFLDRAGQCYPLRIGVVDEPGPGSGVATEAELITHCKSRLAGYKAPTSVEVRESIPRTATGKVQRTEGA